MKFNFKSIEFEMKVL